jgi:T-complex protein 1 subunit beta
LQTEFSTLFIDGKFLSASMQQAPQTGTTEEKGEIARLQSFVGAIAIGDLVKTTLGPKGMDKILQSMDGQGPRGESITVTNDGATILKSIWVDNPAAKILIDISKTQDEQCGDGTTGVVVLAAELLRNAEELVERQRVHPQLIIQGYRAALAAAREQLSKVAFDHGRDEKKFREDLLSIARTTLSSKLLNQEKEHFAQLAVDAILRLKGKPLDYIQLIKKAGGSLKDSYLAEGFILEKRIGTGMPKVIRDCKVMVANTPMDTDKIKIYGAKIKVDSLDAVQDIEAAEKEKMKHKVEKIISHGCNVFINRQLIYNYPEQLFKDHDVVAIEHSDFDGTERLAAVLGADIVSTFDNPSKTKLGRCDEIREILIGEDRVIQFKGCAQNEACSIVLRGASTHVLEEADRSLHDALAVLHQTVQQESRIVYGGGAAEMSMANSVLQLAHKTEGKAALAVEAFAKALQAVPTIIADNGGYDSAELVTRLRAAHAAGKSSFGLDMTLGDIADMADLRICESYRSKLSQLCSAAEGAEMIIRVDNVIRNAPRQRSGGM